MQALLLGLYAFPFLDLSMNLDLGPILFSILWIFSSLGVFIIFISILQMKRSLSPFPSPRKDGALIENGLFKWVRHPIYSGILLSTLSYAIISGSLARLLCTILLFTFFYIKSSYEEGLLEKTYPKYAEYKKRGGRFFPRMSSWK